MVSYDVDLCDPVSPGNSTEALVATVRERRELKALLASGALRAARRAAGMTQAQIAQRCGVRQTTVAEWECHGRLPRGDAARSLRALILELKGS